MAGHTRGMTRGRVRRALRTIADVLGRVVADRPASRKPPGANFIPNSDGEGGKVISSGRPGGS